MCFSIFVCAKIEICPIFFGRWNFLAVCKEHFVLAEKGTKSIYGLVVVMLSERAVARQANIVRET